MRLISLSFFALASSKIEVFSPTKEFVLKDDPVYQMQINFQQQSAQSIGDNTDKSISKPWFEKHKRSCNYLKRYKCKKDRKGYITNKLPCALKWNIFTMKIQTHYKGMKENSRMVHLKYCCNMESIWRIVWRYSQEIQTGNQYINHQAEKHHQQWCEDEWDTRQRGKYKFTKTDKYLKDMYLSFCTLRRVVNSGNTQAYLIKLLTRSNTFWGNLHCTGFWWERKIKDYETFCYFKAYVMHGTKWKLSDVCPGLKPAFHRKGVKGETKGRKLMTRRNNTNKRKEWQFPLAGKYWHCKINDLQLMECTVDSKKPSGTISEISFEGENKKMNLKTQDDVIRSELYYCCKENKSLNLCVQTIAHKLNIYTLDRHVCSITDTMPAHSHKIYEGYKPCSGGSRKLYANCGVETSLKPDSDKFKSACVKAANKCGSDLSCARVYIVKAHDNNSNKWCSNGKFNFMLNPNPGTAVLSAPSSGAQVTAGKIYCTGFCIA